MPADSSKYRVLVIEDNPGDYVLVEDFLYEQIEAPTITHAESFEKASSILTKDGQRFDVVLLDLSLSDRTGEGLIHDIVGLCPDIPVIVLTGYADFAFGVKSLSMGIADYILKEELTALILYKSIVYSSERRRISSALLESEHKYSELFHLSPLPMWVCDCGTLKFIDVNNAAIRHYGFSLHEFLDMSIVDIQQIGSMPEAMPSDPGFPERYMQGIVDHRKKNGEMIRVDLRSNALQYKGTSSRIILANDVTERLNYINAIEAQNRKLKEIAWMQSHVIRAPLSRIMGLISIIRDSKGSTEERDEMLGYLMTSAHELDKVIRNITELT